MAFINLSKQQKDIWLAEEKNKDVSFDVTCRIDFSEDLDVIKLEAAVSELLRRHVFLRAAWFLESGEPKFIIESNVSQSRILKCHQTHGEETGDEPIRTVPRRFLEGELLWRADYHSSNFGEFYLEFRFSHLIIDDVSINKVIEEIQYIYNNGSDNISSPQEVDHEEYVAWQKTLHCLTTQKAKELAKKITSEELHVSFSNSAQINRTSSATYTRKTSTKESFLIRSSIAKHKITFFCLFVSAIGVIFSRHLNKDSFTIGVPKTLRFKPEYEKAVGNFVDLSVYRVESMPDKTISEYLQVNSARIADLYDEAYPSYSDVVRELRSELSPGDIAPSIVVNEVSRNEQPLKFGDSDARLVESSLADSCFGIKFTLTQHEHSYAIRIDHDKNYLAENYAAEIIEQIIFFASSAHSTGDKLAVSVSLQDRKVLDSLLLKYSNLPFAKKYPAASISEQFKNIVTRFGEGVAVVDELESLTYTELLNRAECMAGLLQARGVEPGDRVGVLLNPSISTVIAILAVLLARATYVPLSEAMPQEYIDSIIDSSRIRVIITEGDAPTVYGGSINVSVEESQILKLEYKALTATHEDLAYVLFTSGTTGKPKGVEVSHQNVTRLISALNASYSFSPSDVWCLYHSIIFDFSVWEMWGALLTGAKLAIPTRKTAKSPEDFFYFLKKSRVTVLNQTPTALRSLAGWFNEYVSVLTEECPELRLLILGGEEFKNIPACHLYTNKRTKIINMYGITETTVHATHCVIQDAETPSHKPIGQPLNDMNIYILQETMAPTAIGEIGTIYVAGGGVTAGYLNNKIKTEENFIPDPFRAGEVMYNSGDVAKILPDGNIYYLGRKDQQVKIRGHRVELSAVERACFDIGIADEAVTYTVETNGTLSIALALKLSLGHKGETPSSIRKKILQKLPKHYIPSVVNVLDDIPRTVNGKVDKSSLPRKNLGKVDNFVLGSIFEDSVLEAYKKFLGEGDFFVGSDFYMLGGDSLSAVKISSYLQKKYDLKVTVSMVLDYPSPRELAEFIESIQG